MKKGDILKVRVNETVYPDTSLIKIDDKTIELKKVIEGQELEILINKKRKNKFLARVLNLIKKSPLQKREGCILDGKCGACLYQGIYYEDQLKIKKRQIKKLVEDANDKEFIFEGILGSPLVSGYRNKMEYSFGDEVKDGELSLGLHKKNSNYDILHTNMCELVHEDFNKILEISLDFFREKKLPYYHKVRHEGFLRYLIIRRSTKTKELLLNLVTTSSINKLEDPNKSEKENELSKELYEVIEEWASYILSKKECLEAKIVGILHTKTDSYADAIKDPKITLLYGRDYFFENLLDLDFKISPFSFFQTNSLGAEVLYEKVREYIKETGSKKIFDLYSGTGTIAQIVSKEVDRVYAIEIIKEAVEAAKENANLNKIDNCTFLCGDVLKVIDELEEKPELIILDPPRDGIHKKALPKIVAFNPKHIIYVSCKPSSFVRDLEFLKENSYSLKKIVAVDMFPFTPNLETVALLSKLNT